MGASYLSAHCCALSAHRGEKTPHNAQKAERKVRERERERSGEENHDQVIRENPASRGTETSAEVLVGPPWRMGSNAGQQQWY